MNGLIGHDYSYFLPKLLDGWYWVIQNGFFNTPWFTPSWCGGVPAFPNPQDTFYSLPQFLTFFFNPVVSVQTNFLIFGMIGFWGTYFSCRQILGTSKMGSLLGAAFFLFNGFSISRHMVGHLTFHSFYLLPWFFYFSFRKISTENSNIEKNHCLFFKKFFLDSFILAIICAYIIFSGSGVYIMPIIFISSLASGLILNFKLKKYNVFQINGRLFIGILFGIIASSSKWVSSIYLVKNFPRDYYPIGGFSDISSLIYAIFYSLFLQLGRPLNLDSFTNDILNLGPHEFSYSLTFIPFFIICFALIKWFFLKIRKINGFKLHLPKIEKGFKFSPFCIGFLLIFIFLTPILLNFYSSQWHGIIKSIPYIKNNSVLFRWVSIYIFPIIVFLSLSIDYLLKSKKNL